MPYTRRLYCPHARAQQVSGCAAASHASQSGCGDRAASLPSVPAVLALLKEGNAGGRELIVHEGVRGDTATARIAPH